MAIEENINYNILKTNDLSIGYPDRKIASKINIKLRPGELTAVIGVNGAGKSTLLNTLTGKLPKITGNISLAGKNLTKLSSKTIAKTISVVLTNAAISQNLTVGELVALGRHPYTNWLGILREEDKTQVYKALAQIGIVNLKNRKCSELSDGQLQKVFLARALAQDTDLIAMDEPTVHLDLYHKYLVFKTLKVLVQSTEKAVIFASHELNLALQLCDTLVLVLREKVIQDTPENLIERGLLNEIFPDNLVIFDKKSGNFRINQN